MTKQHIRIAQGIIGFVFALAVIYFIAGIVTDKKTGPIKAQERFDALAYETRNLATTYEPTSDAFKKGFSALFGEQVNDVIALQLYLNNQLLYTYVSDTTIDDAATIRLTEDIRTVYGNTLSVSGLLYSFRPQAIFTHARVSFVLIALGTLSAIVLLIFVQVAPVATGKKKTARRDDEIIIEDYHAERNDDGRNDDDAAQDEDEYAAETADMSDDAPAQAPEDTDDDDDFDPIGEMEEENRQSAEDDLAEDDDAPAADDDSISFEDGTNVTPEEDTDGEAITEAAEDELSAEPADTADEDAASAPDALTFDVENELADAIANEQDISVLIVQLRGLTAESVAVQQLKKLLRERLGKQGLVHDYKDGIALVIRNTNLDTALAFAQSLNNAISVIVQRSGERAETAIGISARAFRMLNAPRLITEAEQAALHADAENPIIAFRVNPEKYKQYMQEEA